MKDGDVKKRVEIERNKVLRSFIGNRFYFCPRVKVSSDGVMAVVGGTKHDVTDDLQPYLLKKYRRKE